MSTAETMNPQSTSGFAPAHRIAIVEDDTVISDQMREAFEDAGFAVTEVRGGDEIKALLGRGGISLVTLDLALSGEDGIDLAREIRKRYDVPIVIVTASSRKISRIVGLEVGADDYVVKPFDFDELIARVRAVLRRARGGQNAAGASTAGGEASGIVTFEGWRFDIAGHRLWGPSGSPVDLTAAECDLLAIFVASPRIALSRLEIAQQLRGEEDQASERSIDVIVGRLRRKLEAHADGVELIKTLRGSGYLFCGAVLPAQ